MYTQFCSLLAFAGQVSAQKVAVKTNALYWMTATPDIGMEFALAGRWTIELAGGYNSWTFDVDSNVKAKHFLVTPEIRYWFCESFNGHFIGQLAYREKDTQTVKPVPAGSFVPFEMLPTYNRIGTVTISDSGKFELRLHSEYRYDWTTDDVKFQFTASDGKIYEKTFDCLSALKASSSGQLTLEPVQ